jgi:catechol 2,3-dioxygenase-like lactoylglutathione lyase family enzyme
MAAVVHHVGQCTAHLDAMVRFYVEAIGFEVERDLRPPDAATADLLMVEPPVGLHAVYLRLGDFTLELLEFERDGNPPRQERAFNEPGLTHVSVSVDDVDATLAKVVELGGSVASSLGGMAAVVRDPDGQLLEILPMSYRQQI